MNKAGSSGITPAHAGSIVSFSSPQFYPQDHPRACGEHQMNRLFYQMTLGSPPRMRGALHHYRIARRSVGITPAHAGSITPLPNCTSIRWDHPRACGEHYLKPIKITAHMGSPPRMRGA